MKSPERIYLVDPDIDEEEDAGPGMAPETEGVYWCEDRVHKSDVEYIRADLAALSQGTRQAEPVALSPTHERAAPAPEVPDGVWEALQRLIENGMHLGPASAEDALLVAKYRRQLVASPSQPVAAEGVMEPMTWPEIDEAARRAQISFCLDKKPSFEIALVREVEAHHGIASGSAESKKGE